MHFTLTAILLALGLFGGMLASLELGRAIGARHAALPAGAKASAGTLEAAVFGLMGLVIAFSFGGAVTRFDQRRQLVVEEVNAVGTAWLRLDMLPQASQPELRELFRAYADTRIEMYARLPDVDAAMAQWGEAQKLQGAIWRAAVAACRTDEGARAAILVLPALNAMFDLSATRTMAAKMHPPLIVFVLLFGLAFGGSMLAGYDLATSRTRSWFHIMGFALVLAVTVYVILDIEYPNLGLIRIDDFHQAFRDARQAMG